MENFKQKILESQKRQKEIWLREFERNGRKINIWELNSESISPPKPKGMGIRNEEVI